MFRLVKTQRCDRKCVELQRLVKHVAGTDRAPGVEEWVSYCILANPDQALEVVEHFEPQLVGVAQKDLANAIVLDSKVDPALEVRVMPKHVRPW